MPQSGYTPILIYASGTATNTPSAANLTSSSSGAELALNYTDGKLYYKDNGGVVQLLASKAGASGSVTSVAQSFTGGLISVSGSPITTSGTLALTVAGTSGGVPYFSSASTWASSAALSANALMVGGGAGAAPSTITTGTGVVTALGVNTGTAGAFVVNGGALGTPSSGTVTNLTGTASININGTVGATTQNTGYFTNVRLYGSTSGYVGLSPAAVAGSTTYTLPSADGTNGQSLTTNGSGVLSWSSAGTSPIPSGTVMLFYQASAPTGWTQVTTLNDYALRIVSGTGGTTGGTTAFSTVFANQTPTITTSGLSVGATTLSSTQIPAHTHTLSSASISSSFSGSADSNVIYNNSGTNLSVAAGSDIGRGYTPAGSVSSSLSSLTLNNTGGGGSHTHTLSGSATSSAITLNVQYANIIICSKN
jgi:hypothetical protein